MEAQTLRVSEYAQATVLPFCVSVPKLWVNELGHCMPN